MAVIRHYGIFTAWRKISAKETEKETAQRLFEWG